MFWILCYLKSNPPQRGSTFHSAMLQTRPRSCRPLHSVSSARLVKAASLPTLRLVYVLPSGRFLCLYLQPRTRTSPQPIHYLLPLSTPPCPPLPLPPHPHPLLPSPLMTFYSKLPGNCLELCGTPGLCVLLYLRGLLSVPPPDARKPRQGCWLLFCHYAERQPCSAWGGWPP